MPPIDLGAARTFIHLNARLLDRHRYAHQVQADPADLFRQGIVPAPSVRSASTPPGHRWWPRVDTPDLSAAGTSN